MSESMAIMSAATLTSGLRDTGRNESFPVFHGDQFLLRRIGVEPRHERCPSCDSIIYSRRHSRCGVCEQVLPASFLFSCAEAQRVDRLLKTERQRHRAWLMRTQASEQ